jgi:SulP family sulfate permease
MIHSIFVLLILVFFAPLASHIPLASMAPILMLVAWNMSERKEFKFVLKTRTGDSLVLCATFLCTVLTDITIGVSVGLGLSILFFVFRMSREFVVKKGANTQIEANEQNEQIHIYTLKGPIFFGSAKQLTRVLEIGLPKQFLILSIEHVPYMDITAEAVFEAIVRKCKQHHVQVLLVGLQAKPRALLESTGLYHSIGEKFIFPSLQTAQDYCLETNNSKVLSEVW